MNPKRNIKILFLFSFFLLVISCPVSASPDHAVFSSLLEKHVTDDGLVDYKVLKTDHSDLDNYISKLGNTDPSYFREASREEILAFWINAYNAGILQHILENYPLERISKGKRDAHLIRIAGEGITLGEIEEGKLLRQFRDERINFALSDGTLGGPRLRSEAYTAENVEKYLRDDVERFLFDASKNKIQAGAKDLLISKIFLWNAEDFILNYGAMQREKYRFDAKEMAVLSFIAHYSDDETKKYLKKQKYDIEFLPYDWRINEKEIKEKG